MMPGSCERFGRNRMHVCARGRECQSIQYGSLTSPGNLPPDSPIRPSEDPALARQWLSSLKSCGKQASSCPGPNGPGLIEAWTAPTPNQAATRCGSFRRTASPRPPALRDPSNRLSSSMLLHSPAGFLVTLEREWETLFDSARTDLLEQRSGMPKHGRGDRNWRTSDPGRFSGETAGIEVFRRRYKIMM